MSQDQHASRRLRDDELQMIEMHGRWISSKGADGAAGDFTEHDFRGVEFPRHTILARAKLLRAKLHDAELINADLCEADLFEADLSGASLLSANLAEANLIKARLPKARLIAATLSGPRLLYVVMPGADLTDAKLCGVNLTQAILSGAILERADLSRSTLFEADLRGSNLRGANLAGANLVGADLAGADLLGAKLGDADLRFTRGLRLNGTFIREARFSPVASPLRVLLNRISATAIPVLSRWAAQAGSQTDRRQSDQSSLAGEHGAEHYRLPENDPWSVLRQSYAGPRLAFLLIALIIFAAPYIARALLWASVSRVEASFIQTAQRLQEADQRATNAGLPVKEQMRETAGAFSRRSEDRLRQHFQQHSLVVILLRLDQGTAASVLALVLIVYNLCVFTLVYSIAPLRDEEERSGYSPAWPEYRWLVWLHRIATVLLYVSLGSFVFNVWQLLSVPIWVPSFG
jgi:uncharacterized protein YjbI with pentapeptide repeats